MRVAFILSALLMAQGAFALDDACTKPKEFTVDRRCYVTDAQKKQKPFNAVVRVKASLASESCSGTIVDINGALYIYTAAHCVENLNTGKVKDAFFLTQTDEKLTGNMNNMGNRRQGRQDYAIYSLKQSPSALPHVEKSGKWAGVPLVNYDARVVGYGGMKIMSDNDIREFKQKYIDWLKKYKHTTLTAETGLKNGGIYVHNGVAKEFMNYLTMKEFKYSAVTFSDRHLKTSQCEYSSKDRKIKGCQGWGGDSGGGIFDANGNLMGILTRGAYIIGGDSHGDITENVNLLK